MVQVWYRYGVGTVTVRCINFLLAPTVPNIV